MKIASSILTAGLLFASGCFPNEFLQPEKPKTEPTPQIAPRPGKPHALVTPEQVDEKNCRDKEKALRRELELDSLEAERTAVTPSTAEKK
jgi:hypothetical protein